MFESAIDGLIVQQGSLQLVINTGIMRALVCIRALYYGVPRVPWARMWSNTTVCPVCSSQLLQAFSFVVLLYTLKLCGFPPGTLYNLRELYIFDAAKSLTYSVLQKVIIFCYNGSVPSLLST